MDKELNEAIERLNRFKKHKILYGDTFAMHLEQLNQVQKDIETILNYIENSIPKKKIEDKIEQHTDYLINQAVTSNPTLDTHFREKEQYIIRILQELLVHK